MLAVKNLVIKTQQNKVLINHLNFCLDSGVFKAIVGESGSGKSLTALSIAKLLAPSLSVEGEILWNNKSVLHLSDKDLYEYRKTELAFVFQNPMHCLNPIIRCGQQIEEVFELRNIPKANRNKEVDRVLLAVGLHETDRVKNAYPHELSGGQKQRIMIAIALASEAKLLIADEPSTALDVLVQKEILDLLKTLQNNEGLSVLFITHDLKLAFKYADEVIVMKDGEIVEQNTVDAIQNHPKEKYTQGLIQCRPQATNYQRPLPTVEEFINGTYASKSDVKRAVDFNEKQFQISNLEFSYGSTKVLKSLTFDIFKGESLGIVGASGSGKSTLGNCLMKINTYQSGEIQYHGESINKIEHKYYLSKVQMVFQDPYGSLDGRPKIKRQFKEIYNTYHPHLSKNELVNKMIDLLNQVGLDASYLDKRPRDLSGGQRQRVCIARCLITGAKTIILDESIAALDVSIQAKILNLLNDLKEKMNLTYIFISHDLESVYYFCDRILVLNQGKIEELNTADNIMHKSQSDYTKQLLKASL